MDSNTIKTTNTTVMNRESGIELFRIITMMVIIAHHYVVNSGLMPMLCEKLSANNLLLLILGSGGKIGINCFIFITGYFMCKSKITIKKFLKLLLWVEFYKLLFYLIFTLTGYQEFTFRSMIKSLLPVTSVSNGFSSTYLIFYLFIPFLNVLVKNLAKKQHEKLIILCIVVYSILPMLQINVTFNYVTWFSIVYVIASYIRLYPIQLFNNKKFWGFATLLTILISCISIIFGAISNDLFGINLIYFCVTDSNKILALVTALCAFMYFKNLNIGYVKTVNIIASSAYGVLLIHANSDAMRKWLWQDLLNNVGVYNNFSLVIVVCHLICSVIAIYIVCTVIDQIRLRLIEKPLFKLLEKKKIIK